MRGPGPDLVLPPPPEKRDTLLYIRVHYIRRSYAYKHVQIGKEFSRKGRERREGGLVVEDLWQNFGYSDY